MSDLPVRLHHDRALTTIQDAIEELGRRSRLPSCWSGQIKVGGILLPGYVESGLAQLIGPIDLDGIRWSIGMPSSAEFTARRAISPNRDTYRIERLDGAIVDEEANVTLTDEEETRLFDVRLTPSELFAKLTDRQEDALLLALFCIGKQMYPIRYELLPNFVFPELKEIMAHIEDQRARCPSIPSISPEVLRSALAIAGVRPPRYRRHAG